MAPKVKNMLLSLFVASSSLVNAEFTEEAEPSNARADGPQEIDRPCMTVMNVENPEAESKDNGAAENAMNTLLFEVTRPEHYVEDAPPSLGDYTSPSSLFDALQEPSMNFTVLIPPTSQVKFVHVALAHNLITYSDALRLSLLHIVPGRYLEGDLRASMEKGRQLLTINDEFLDVVIGTEFSQLEVMFAANSVQLVGLDRASCKPGSVVHHVSSVIWDASLQEVDKKEKSLKNDVQELQKVHAQNIIGQKQKAEIFEKPEETRSSKNMDTGMMIIIILTVVLCTPFCCLLCKKMSQRVSVGKRESDCSDDEFEAYVAALKERRCTHEKILPIGRWLNGTGGQQSSAAPPQVLYRMDGNLWSTMPPCSPSPHSASFKQMKVHDNHAYDDMLRPQSEGLKPYEGASADFGHPMSNACSRCMEREGDHVLLPCGHGGFCGPCAQQIFKPAEKRHLEHSGRNIGGDTAACGQCPICCAPLTAVVQVPVDTPIGSSGNILQVSAGGFGESAGLLSFDRSHSQRSELPLLELMGPKCSVNYLPERSSFSAVPGSDALENHIQGGITLPANPPASHPQKTLVPLKRESVAFRQEDSSMENIASFMVWEEQASEAGTSNSRASQQLREDVDGRYTLPTTTPESNPIAFW